MRPSRHWTQSASWRARYVMLSVMCRPHILTQPRMQPVRRSSVRKQSAKQLKQKEFSVPTHLYKPLKFKVHACHVSVCRSAIIPCTASRHSTRTQNGGRPSPGAPAKMPSKLDGVWRRPGGGQRTGGGDNDFDTVLHSAYFSKKRAAYRLL
jgi:hypothetical protein